MPQSTSCVALLEQWKKEVMIIDAIRGSKYIHRTDESIDTTLIREFDQGVECIHYEGDSYLSIKNDFLINRKFRRGDVLSNFRNLDGTVSKTVVLVDGTEIPKPDAWIVEQNGSLRWAIREDYLVTVHYMRPELRHELQELRKTALYFEDLNV